MNDYDWQPDDFDVSSETRYWTLRRIIVTIIILITLIAFVTYVLVANLAFSPRPQPPTPTLEIQRG
jgi:hypothetical protein